MSTTTTIERTENTEETEDTSWYNDLITEIAKANDIREEMIACMAQNIATFDEHGLAERCGASSTVAWLTRTLNIARSTAYNYLKVGKAMKKYPTLKRAFADGDLSYAVTLLLTNYLTEDNEHDLVLACIGLTVRDCEQLLAGLDGTSDAPEPRANYFRLSRNKRTGRVRLTGELDDVTAMQFLNLLKIGQLSNTIDFSSIDPELLHDPDAVDQLLEESLARDEEDAGAPEPEPASEQPEPEQPEPSPHNGQQDTTPDPKLHLLTDAIDKTSTISRFGLPTRADNMINALMGLINLVRCTAPRTPRYLPAAKLNIIVDPDGHMRMPLRPTATSNELATMIFNSEARTHILDHEGVPLFLGRSRRLVTKAQEEALLVSFNYQCATPGCPNTNYLEFHHIHEWSEGGPTDTYNLVSELV